MTELESRASGSEANNPISSESTLSAVWRRSQRYCMIGLFSAIATGVYLTPLQKYFTMGRYQHYGITISLFGLGYILQTIWSWKTFTKWARVSYLSTGVFFAIVGMTFYENPWLDARMQMQRSDQEAWKIGFVGLYVLSTIAIISVWMKWIKEETAAKKLPKEKEVEV